MVAVVRLTKPQRKALEWLPGDMSWRTQEPAMAQALCSLALFCKGIVEFQPPVGRNIKSKWRLTHEGVKLKNVMFPPF